VEEYLNTAVQGAGAMFDYMYEKLPEPMVEQRENALRYEPEPGTH
jgi:hypothetical protein